MVQKIEWTIRSLNDLLDIYGVIPRDSTRYSQIEIIVMSIVHGHRLLKEPPAEH
jgi:hypothetical protein